MQDLQCACICRCKFCASCIFHKQPALKWRKTAYTESLLGHIFVNFSTLLPCKKERTLKESKQGFKNIRDKNISNKLNSQQWFEHTKLLCKLILSPLLNTAFHHRPSFYSSHSHGLNSTESWNTWVTYVVIWRLIKQWSNVWYQSGYF